MDDSNVIDFKKEGPIADALCALLKEGAQKMLMMAVEAEVDAFVKIYKDEITDTGQRAIVRTGRRSS